MLCLIMSNKLPVTSVVQSSGYSRQTSSLETKCISKFFINNICNNKYFKSRTMDLLGSILSSMDAPPTSTSDKAKRKNLKEQKEKLEKRQQEEKNIRDKFRTKVEKEVNEFIRDSSKRQLKYPPMDQVQRSIIHDVAEIAAITSYSFGEEGFDRHIILFKKEFGPSEEELVAIRRGEDYNPEKIKKALEEKKQNRASPSRGKMKAVQQPKTNYKEKYERLIGKESGKDGAKITVTNDAFGCVPSENKKDLRSIEETLNEIRARKRQKTENDDEPKLSDTVPKSSDTDLKPSDTDE